MTFCVDEVWVKWEGVCVRVCVCEGEAVRGTLDVMMYV